jgi:hypothetical protein
VLANGQRKRTPLRHKFVHVKKKRHHCSIPLPGTNDSAGAIGRDAEQQQQQEEAMIRRMDRDELIAEAVMAEMEALSSGETGPGGDMMMAGETAEAHQNNAEAPMPAIPQRGSPPPARRPRPTISDGDTPRTLLHQHYGTTAAIGLKDKDFCSDSDGPDHRKVWTSVLVCPMTGELFLSRPYNDDAVVYVGESNGVHWFVTKNDAEHAAAAWAINCYQHREWANTAGEDPEPPQTLGTIPFSHEKPILEVHEIMNLLPTQLVQAVANKLATGWRQL